MNDQSLRLETVLVFADDTTIIVYGKDDSLLQAQIERAKVAAVESFSINELSHDLYMKIKHR